MRSLCKGWFGVVPVAIAVALILSAASASATVMHPLLSSFSTETLEGSTFALDIAVDNSSSASAGHVYVGAYSPRVLNGFSATGSFLCEITGAGSTSTSPSECDSSSPGLPQGGTFDASDPAFPVAVDGSGDVYVGDAGTHAVYVFSPSGAYLSEIALPQGTVPVGLAMGAAGDIFIAGRNIVYKFVPALGKLQIFAREQPGGQLTEVNALASDNDPTSSSYGDVYLTENGSGGVLVYNAAGAYVSSISGNAPYALTVDSVDGDLYTAGEGVVDEFAPGGALLSQIEMPSGAIPYAVALNTSSHDVYVSSLSKKRVYIFGSGVVVPTATTAAPSSVLPTSVTLHGAVDPAGAGEITECTFEWGETPSYGETLACAPSPGYTSATEVDSAPITGLSPDTVYHFRIAAKNANGTGSSADGTFETAGKPTIEGEATASAGQTDATVQAALNPHGLATTYKVEYGLCAATCPETYEKVVPASGVAAGAGLSSAIVSQEITGLQRNAEYHYRFVAINSQGTTEAADETFATAASATVQQQSAIAGPHSAAITASIDPAGEATSCQVQYVSEAEYQASQFANAHSLTCAPGALPANAGMQAVHVNLTGLTIGTAYRYRFVLAGASGPTITGQESTVTTFGLSAFAFEMQDSAGNAFTQAGGHPYSVTTNVAITQTQGAPGGNVKDVRVELPVGFVGNPTATATCTRRASEQKACSGAAQVGTIVVQAASEGELRAPLFNLVPPKGVAAELGARFNNFANAFIEAKVRAGGDYGIDAESLNITDLAGVLQVTVTLWGVPSEASHDGERACPSQNDNYEVPCSTPEHGPTKPFLTAPGYCPGTALQASVLADAYQQPDEFVAGHAQTPAVSGCEQLPFAPSLSVQPESNTGDFPTGLHIDLHVPQDNDPAGVATADLQNVTVTFPAGLAVNPSAADGLEACSEEQVGFTGFAELNKASEPGVQTAQFTPGAAECPNASKLGDVEIDTPLLGHPLPGAIYLAQQDANPFGSMIAVYLTVDDPISGVIVKLPGLVQANSQTGQLTATFDQNPQLPFEDLKVDLFGGSSGSRASLTTPLICGSYTTGAVLTPWSSPEGKSVAPSSAPFEIAEAPGGGACVTNEGEAPNKPGFQAGTASPVGGSYSPFVLRLTREDGSQRFGSLNVTLPPGLIGKVAGIEQCPQTDIDKAQSRGHEGEGSTEQSDPSCPSGSEVGAVHVGAGSGAPFYATGRAYFAGPYEGAPFSLVIVTPAVAGPFDLGTVVVRAGLFINPGTAQVTVKSDPFPSILDGIPLDIRSVAVDMNRPGFVLNPTSCNTMAVTGEEKSAAAQTAGLSDRFQAGGCTGLPFHPSLSAGTQGKASRAGGASLTVKVIPAAGQANIAKVDLQLPKQLPARLSTLQKACTEAQFAANPAACPEGSDVGSAIAHTPILNSPLVGPVYLVSHGNAAFPDVEMVLQAEGVEIVLDGQTQIKGGVTYSHFDAVPDAPISDFEAILPAGPHSVLGTNIPASAKYSLCGQSLMMPTKITGQNGAVVTQNTKIAVTGCPKVIEKKLTRPQKLAATLKTCRRKASGKAKRHKREACEKVARKKYGPVRKAKKRPGKKKEQK